jgi:hypothetical protein
MKLLHPHWREFVRDGGDGRQYMGGCLTRQKPVGALVPGLTEAAAREAVPLVPASEWREQESLRGLERRDVNQNGYPACCLASLANAMEMAMVRDGRPHRPLDWRRAWRALSGGRGGVALDVACRFAMDKGFPIDTSADGSSSMQPGGVVKIAEAWDCDSIEGLASGLLRGCLATFGHDMHAECATRLVRQAGRRGWFLDTRNSWGRDWGDAGWHLFPLDEVEIDTYGAILIRELAFAPGELADYPDVE